MKECRIIRREIYSVIDKGIDRDNPLNFCANCGDGYVDVQERLQDICWNMGCPGCEVCGNYLNELIVYFDRINSF
ncbi:MAG: hypothetical protein KAT07_07775 [Calditrichia bacterium]|nr:hypothetical protein [Calditrichia bacterium]